MAKHTLLILNRKSAARPDLRAAVRPIEKELGIKVIIPWSGKDLRKSVREAINDGVTRIVAGGGDGTLNSVAAAVLRLRKKAPVSLGLVPLGTANDFARAFGDKGSDLSASVRIAATKAAEPIDVGYINGKPFVNVASGGFGAMITATTPKEMKKRLGGLAYTLFGLAKLSDAKSVPAQISIDGGAPYKVSISALAIANSRYAGGGFDVAPEAEISDGLLDLSVLSTDRLMPENLPFGRLPDISDSKEGVVQRSRLKSMVLETSQPFHMNLDGEPMVDQRFEVSIKPKALNFVFPGA
ncbi:YegS/Rv2252/BmrU family lipid kinase [Ruegeria arenilitoris]|uniref:YegS/Rv2252/BmrU family lipid kinase n=1 Tax=Ruegeria arenilitoris TaxID=1173585 RepID=UPI001479D0BF|nr:YegS/Rv2252/BmrU family lipid kinase [Ruegeria arenilitoris]